MLGFGTVAKKVFGTHNDRKLKAVRGLIAKINALEPEMEALDDGALMAKTAAFKAQIAEARDGASDPVQAEAKALEAILPEAFAVAREGARRALGLRPFDVQLMGGIFLHRGDIAEMKTGEGKTLVAVLPAYLNALTGRGVHVVTVNDYLARRDSAWMGKVFAALGMTTGVVVPQQPDAEKKAAYAADVTYATNNELGFDYLRDNMRQDLSQVFQRDHYFAIVDEVDSILIDEARTPLIISGPAEDRTEMYQKVDKIVPLLDDSHFTIDEKQRTVTLTDEGNEHVERLLHAEGLLDSEASLYDPESTSLVHHVNQGLRAHKLFKKENHYIVRDGEVMLIDEFTGRMMPGRRLSDGLHQAIEAKEGVEIKPESATWASVTFQNYFRLYQKLAGMTGTAKTEEEEFGTIYGLGVVEVPTNKPIARVDDDDAIYRTTGEKYQAIAAEIAAAHSRGQPTLVGTTSIEKSEMLSRLLSDKAALKAAAKRMRELADGSKKKADKEVFARHAEALEAVQKTGVPHQVLNARQHEKEAKIVAEAGLPGAVTIATNMAGRGTDIQLGGNVEMRVMEALAAEPEADPADLRARVEAEVGEAKAKALEAGGLFVLATERHESRRIDNQLRGRSGRQGDPGKSSFFLSLEDDLMRIFGSERLEKMLTTLGMKEGEAIIHPWVNKALERAQAKVEGRNFDIRKQLLKYDDVMNDQRKAIFSQRREIMEAKELAEIIRDMRHQVVDDLVTQHMPPKSYPDQWTTEQLYGDSLQHLGIDAPIMAWAKEEGVDDEAMRERIAAEADKHIAQKVAKYGPEAMRSVEKQLLLNTIDERWREHLMRLEHLRSVIGFRGYAQRDPLNEYKAEAFQLFESLLTRLRFDVTERLAHIQLLSPEEQQAMLAQIQAQAAAAAQARVPEPEMAVAGASTDSVPPVGAPRPGFDESRPETWGNPGRNDPCPCGSGKKFKHCHGRV